MNIFDWLDWFLAAHSAGIAWAFVGLLSVWVAVLERRRQELKRKLETARADLEMLKTILRARERPATVPTETVARASGDNRVVLAKVWLN